MSIDYRAELQRLLGAVENDVIDTNDGLRFQAAVNRARAALAKPEPEGVTDQEIADTFAQGCREGAGNPDQPPFLAGARAVLARYARPTIKPVPVSERPWEREGWCDAEGNLWAEHISREGTASWRYANRDFLGGWCQRCLPHHALPLPTTH